MRVALVGMDSVYFVPRLCELLSKTAGLEWVACCDLGVCPEEAAANSGQRPQTLAEQYGVPLYHNLDELLAAVEVEAAAVATHPRRVPELTVRLARQGVHLYLVKPAAMDATGLATLRAALQNYPKVAVTGLTYRLQPAIISVVETINEGSIGRVSSLRIMHQHGRLTGWPMESWYRTDLDLSPALYLGWYCVDVLHWITSERIEKLQVVTGSLADPASPQPDTFRAVCTLPSGITASLDVYFGVGWPYPEFEIEVLGAAGALRLSSEGGDLYRAEGKLPLAVFSVDLLAAEIERWVQACRQEAPAWHGPQAWLPVLEDCLRLAEAARRQDGGMRTED